MSQFDELREEIEALHSEYQDEASATLGDDMTRYGETQGALEALQELRERVKEIDEE